MKSEINRLTHVYVSLNQGKLPTFQGTDGTLLFESRAIARYGTSCYLF